MTNFAPQNPARHKTSDWVKTIIITCIPLIGLIMLFVWAFGGSSNDTERKNWARAMLIVYAILLAISLVFSLIAGASFVSLLNATQTTSMSGYPTHF